MATFLPPSEYTITLSGELFKINGIAASNTTTKFSLSPGQYTFNLPYGEPYVYQLDPTDSYLYWSVNKNTADFTIPAVFMVQDGGYNISGGVVDISASALGGVNIPIDYANITGRTNYVKLNYSDNTTDNSNILLSMNNYGTYVDIGSDGFMDTFITPSGERPFFNGNNPIIYDGSLNTAISNIYSRLIPVQPNTAWDTSANVRANLYEDYGLDFSSAQDGSGNRDIFGKKVVMTIDACFNPISLYDYAWGWSRGGIRMFEYAVPLNPSDASSIPIVVTGVADLSAGDPFVLTSADPSFAILTVGSTTDIINNRSAFFTSAINQIKTDLNDISYVQIAVTISNESMPITQAEREALYLANVTNFRVYQGISGETLNLADLTSTQGIFINIPATAQVQSFLMSLSGQSIGLRIRALTGGQTQEDARYDLLGGITAVGGGTTNLPVGTIIKYSGFTFILGDIIGTLDEPAADEGVIPCFKKGTHILTPTGYKAVELLQAGEQVTTRTGATEIVEMLAYIGKKETTPLYRLRKDALGSGVPMLDLYMSNTHAFKHKGVWQHMGCAPNAEFVEEDHIPYYHIITADYFAHTLKAEGVEVETCFRDKGDGVLMLWSCNEKCCRPLKCTLATAADFMAARVAVETKTMCMNLEKNKNIRNKILWAYNADKQMNLPMICTEVDL